MERITCAVFVLMGLGVLALFGSTVPAVVASGAWRPLLLICGGLLVVGLVYGAIRWIAAISDRNDRSGLYD